MSNGTWSVSGIDATNLSNGPITYSVTQTDSAGDLTVTKDATKFTTDNVLTLTSAPNITATNVKNITVTGTGVPNYQILVNIIDGEDDGLDTTTDVFTTVRSDGTWSVTGIDATLLEDGDVMYIASQFDPAGDGQSIFEPATKTTEATFPPSVAMTDPADASFTNDNKPTLTATATDNSGSGLAQVLLQYSSDGGTTWKTAGSAITAAPFTYTFTTALPDGAYQARARPRTTTATAELRHPSRSRSTP